MQETQESLLHRPMDGYSGAALRASTSPFQSPALTPGATAGAPSVLYLHAGSGVAVAAAPSDASA